MWAFFLPCDCYLYLLTNLAHARSPSSAWLTAPHPEFFPWPAFRKGRKVVHRQFWDWDSGSDRAMPGESPFCTHADDQDLHDSPGLLAWLYHGGQEGTGVEWGSFPASGDFLFLSQSHLGTAV